MFHQRPSMRARDSSGNQVSLLNDEPSSRTHETPFSHDYPSYGSPGMTRSISSNSAPSNASSPSTPNLMRADSYESSHNPGDPHSPMTPTYLDDFGRQLPYASIRQYKEPLYEAHDEMAYGYPQPPQYSIPVRPPYGDSRNPSYSEPQVYEEEQYNVKGTKRYPCRFKETHGCDRTFTTSGHASRHSKIHTAEKAVQCTFPGCQKKFTRADNMKQHLETHYKDRSRSSASSKASSAAKSSPLTYSAGVKKQQRVPSRASNRAESRPVPNLHVPEQPPMDPALFEPYFPPTSSYNRGGVQEAVGPQARANGLDALAAAAAQSQG